MFDADYLQKQVDFGLSEIQRLEQERARATEPFDADIGSLRDFIEATQKILARRAPPALPAQGPERPEPAILRLVQPSLPKGGYGAIQQSVLKIIGAAPRGLTKKEVAAELERHAVPILAKSYLASAENNIKDLREKKKLDYRHGRYFLTPQTKAALGA